MSASSRSVPLRRPTPNTRAGHSAPTASSRPVRAPAADSRERTQWAIDGEQVVSVGTWPSTAQEDTPADDALEADFGLFQQSGVVEDKTPAYFAFRCVGKSLDTCSRGSGTHSPASSQPDPSPRFDLCLPRLRPGPCTRPPQDALRLEHQHPRPRPRRLALRRPHLGRRTRASRSRPLQWISI